MKHRLLLVAAIVAAGLSFATQARADVISFFLNQPECTGACGAGSVPAIISNANSVQVSVNRSDSTHAQVTFTGTGTSGNIGVPVELNVAGFFQASSTEPLAPMSPCGNYVGAPAQCSPGSDDHFGTMDVETGAVAAHSIVINLIAELTTTWASADHVIAMTTNFGAVYGHGFEAAVHTGLGGVQYAGYYATVPEPASLAVLGIGLLGLGFTQRRRRA